MKRYETAEEEYREQFSNMKKAFFNTVVLINIGMIIVSYLSAEWGLLLGSLISSFFLYFLTWTIIDNTMKFFIAKYKDSAI